MCSYNQINNSYGCSNSYMMNHLLKNELNFQGFVMSDWQAQHSGVETALAGLDMTSKYILDIHSYFFRPSEWSSCFCDSSHLALPNAPPT